MLALLQRVTSARVRVNEEIVGAIGHGLLVFVGVERNDAEAQAGRLLERVIGYRIFGDEAGKMNRSVRDVKGGLLLVPQFTLPADTCKGMRPSFTPAALPEEGKRLFDYFIERARATHDIVETGRFGAEMQVELTNDGPVTFMLRVAPTNPEPDVTP